MAVLTALLIFAAAAEAGAQGQADPSQLTRVTASSQVSVRILSGARVTLGQTADAGSFTVTSASVRLEDGSSRSAQLVEFQ